MPRKSNPYPGNTPLPSPDEATQEALARLENAHTAILNLVKVRAYNKLSFTRVSGVAREVKDLIKVLSIYNITSN